MKMRWLTMPSALRLLLLAAMLLGRAEFAISNAWQPVHFGPVLDDPWTVELDGVNAALSTSMAFADPAEDARQRLSSMLVWVGAVAASEESRPRSPQHVPGDTRAPPAV